MPKPPPWVSALRIIGIVTIICALFWSMAWAIVPSTISVLGFSSSCGVPIFEAFAGATDPVTKQCQQQSAQHLFVGVVGGLTFLTIGLAFTAASRTQRSSWVAAQPPIASPRPASPPPAPPPQPPTASPTLTPPPAPTRPARPPATQATKEKPHQRRPKRHTIVIAAMTTLVAAGLASGGYAIGRGHHSHAPGSPKADSRSLRLAHDGDTTQQTLPTPNLGYGSVTIGMSESALRATGKVTSWENIDDDAGCGELPLSYPGAHAWVQRNVGAGGAVVAIDFGRTMQTSAGIRLGSTLTNLVRVYPNLDDSGAANNQYTDALSDKVKYLFFVDHGLVQQIVMTWDAQQCAE